MSMKVITTMIQQSSRYMKKPSKRLFENGRIDQFGTMASSLCMVHCAICGLLPITVGALGLGFLLSHEIELALTVFAVLFAFGACVQGWKLHHSKRVFALFFVGILSLLGSRALEMGISHDEHHGESHHDESHHLDPQMTVGSVSTEAVLSVENTHEDHHDDGTDILHTIGGLIGVCGGLILVVGHLLNIRARKKIEEACCA